MTAYIYMIKAVREDMLQTGLTEHERVAFQKHTVYLEDLAKKGVLIISGRTMSPENSIGIGIFYADSDADAQRIVDGDPFVSHGVVTPTLMQFGLAAGTALESGRPGRSQGA